MSEWHVWSITPQKYIKVCEFLSSLIESSEIDLFLYPTVTKDYNTKAGWKTKEVPVYGSYVFIKYNHSNTMSAKLSDYLWIHDYVGKCSPKEIKEVKKLSKMKYEDVMPVDELRPGVRVKLIGTAFKGFDCEVVDIQDSKVTVSVTIFGTEKLVKCSIDDIDVEGLK